jgi:DDE superfamily endonuclease
MDEGRFGLKVWFQRRWCPYRMRPLWIVEDHYEWRWLYAAVEPVTGNSFWALMPGVDSDCLGAFLDAFAQQIGEQRVGLVLDGSGAHRAQAVDWPDGIVPLRLPPYSPELNPVELIFRHLRAQLSNRIFADLAELEAAITTVLQTFWDAPATLRRLTSFNWWLDGVADVLPVAS